MAFAILADLRARLARLLDAAARSFAALRRAVVRRLAAALDTPLAHPASGPAGPVETTSGLASRAGSVLGPRGAAVVDRVRAALAAPDAVAAAARTYLALRLLGIVASLAGAPVLLLALLALARGAVTLALAAAVVAPALGRLRGSATARAGLHALRVGAAVGLLWLAGVSFALGWAVYPRPAAEVAAYAAAGHVDSPPAVAAASTPPAPAPVHRPGERSSRPRRRAVTTAGLA